MIIMGSTITYVFSHPFKRTVVCRIHSMDTETRNEYNIFHGNSQWKEATGSAEVQMGIVPNMKAISCDSLKPYALVDSIFRN